MVDAVTTVEAEYGKWTISVRDKNNVVQQWYRSFTDGLEAHYVAFQLGLIERSLSATASAFALNNRYRSEGESVVDENVLMDNGFTPRGVEFRYRTHIGQANVGGPIFRPEFTTVPAEGEVVHFTQPGLDGNLTVLGVQGPFPQGNDLIVTIVCEAV